MEVSIFLAKLIGLYLLTVFLIAIVRRKAFETNVKTMMSSPGIIALSGIVSLLIGIAILLGHPVWEWSWRVVISIIGVLAVIQGILRLGFTSEMQNFFRKKESTFYWIMLSVTLLLGGYLIFHGYYPY